MAEITQKLHYWKGGVTVDISLYNSTSDMHSNYLSLRVGGQNVYAALGDSGEIEATGLKVRKGGVTYSVMKTNRYELPSGFIAIFQGTCPTGWTRETTFDNLFIRGASAYTGVSAGSATHTHSYTRPSCNTTVYDGSNKHADGTGYLFSNNTHYHVVSSETLTTPEGNSEPPYMTVIFCRKD